MGLFTRRSADERVDVDRDRDRTERTGTSPGIIRALFTLASVAAAGLLIWIAQTITDGPLNAGEVPTGDYWWAVLFLAAAGLVLGLGQLFGGWTKWGWPTLSPMVFLLGFLPTLIIGGWILLAKQPQGGVEEGRFDRWSGDIGVSGFVNDLNIFLPTIPVILGIVLAFSFDTTGPRTRIVTDRGIRRDEDVRDEDVQDYRPVGARTTTTTSDTATSSDTTVAEDLRRREPVATGSSDERVELRERDRRDIT
jgi:hypothetical protein